MENPEALSVIEGLRLPDWVLLLPMPSAPVLRNTAPRTLLRDYWARRFEGEVARTWQMAREDNQDLERCGPAVLRPLIGPTALAEAREVLTRDGVPGAAAGELALCRALLARVVRLRYFAPGTRGCAFPAIRDWAALDRWLAEGGLDLPPPRSSRRLPQALERTRPSVGCGTPGVWLPLPADLPFGRSDPDRLNGVQEPPGPALDSGPAAAAPGSAPAALAGPPGAATADRAPVPAAPALTDLQARCLRALHQGTAIRRRLGRRARLGAALAQAVRPLVGGLPALWNRLWGRALPGRPRPPGERALRVHLRGLRSAAAAAQAADWDGCFATALGHLAAARTRYAALAGPGERIADPVSALLEQRQDTTADIFTTTLAAGWHLAPAAADDLGALLRRLAGAQGAAARPARALLAQLETALRECRTTYSRLSWRASLRPAGLRQVLPFQGSLKALAALDSARRLLEDLPWPVADLDRLGAPLAAAAAYVRRGLEQRLRARLLEVLETAGLLPAHAEGRLAAHRLADALADLIRRHRHLRFADLRDLLNQDALSLPDAGWADWRRGDCLGRFDRAAAAALPGVYRPGEFYVKGLQRLSAPLFGTGRGRLGLRVVLLPGLAAWAALEVTALVWGLVTPDGAHPALTTPAAVLLLAATLSAGANTGPGRDAARRCGRWAMRLGRLLLFTGLPRLLRSAPVQWLLNRRLVRRLHEQILAPVTLGLLPLLPLTALWLLAHPQDLGPAAWAALLTLAYALGTLLRETPAGRRGLDDLATGWRHLRDLLRQERLADLIAPVMAFFKQWIRTLDEGLHRIRTHLSPRLGEGPVTTLLKTLVAPLWAAWESVVQFYVVVLIEPQTNPIKHFPVVTLGHKLLLPWLPTLSYGLHAGLSPLLPNALAFPLIAATIFLLPGLFGFLFWELKENWRLYAANRTDPVPAARVGAHGETLAGLLRRGLRGGTIPKAFDRLRQVLDRQVRDETPDPRALRRALARLAAITALIARFAERELVIPLRAACRDPATTTPAGTAQLVLAAPRVASHEIELRVQRGGAAAGSIPLELVLRLAPAAATAGPGSETGAGLVCTLAWRGAWCDLGSDLGCDLGCDPGCEQDPDLRPRMMAVIHRFIRRCGARAAEFDARAPGDPGSGPGAAEVDHGPGGGMTRPCGAELAAAVPRASSPG